MGLVTRYVHRKVNKEGRGSLLRPEDKLLTDGSEQTEVDKPYKMSSVSSAMISQLERNRRGCVEGGGFCPSGELSSASKSSMRPRRLIPK